MENINNRSTSIKNWAVDDRPREKLLAKGPLALSDSELLAILINNGQKERSALQLADQICKSTPIFIIQGTADWRVTATQVLDLSKKFYELKQPFRLSIFEGADHGVVEFMDEVSRQTKTFFDDYLRDKKKWPSLEQHGE